MADENILAALDQLPESAAVADCVSCSPTCLRSTSVSARLRAD